MGDFPSIPPLTGGVVGAAVACCGWLLMQYRKALLGGEKLASERVTAVKSDADVRVADLREDFEEWKTLSEADRARVQAQLVECEHRCKEQDETITALKSEMRQVKWELSRLRDVS